MWSLFFFELARRSAIREQKKDDEKRLTDHSASKSKKAVENSMLGRRNEHIGEKASLGYYHSKFKPPVENSSQLL